MLINKTPLSLSIKLKKLLCKVPKLIYTTCIGLTRTGKCQFVDVYRPLNSTRCAQHKTLRWTMNAIHKMDILECYTTSRLRIISRAFRTNNYIHLRWFLPMGVNQVEKLPFYRKKISSIVLNMVEKVDTAAACCVLGVHSNIASILFRCTDAYVSARFLPVLLLLLFHSIMTDWKVMLYGLKW